MASGINSTRRSRRELRYQQDERTLEKDISQSSEPKAKNNTEMNEGVNNTSSFTSFNSLE